MRYFSFIISLICLLCLTSCLKNEFTLNVSLQEAADSNLTIIYRGASDKQNFVADQTIPLSHGALQLKGATNHPTVIWILSPAHEELFTIYAERGDELQVTGKLSDPLLWQVKGNKVMEEYCKWVRANETVLRGRDAVKINKVVAKYVKENPDQALAPFLLLSRFTQPGHEKEFDTLWGLLKDEKEAAGMREAFMPLPSPAEEKGAVLPLMPVSLPAQGDTMLTVNPSAAKATVIYFWQDISSPLHKQTVTLLHDADSIYSLQTADIFMGGDSVQWSATRDTHNKFSPRSMWALGAETNVALRRLNIPSTPYIIIADKKGKQLYRGADPEAARKVINNIK